MKLYFFFFTVILSLLSSCRSFSVRTYRGYSSVSQIELDFQMDAHYLILHTLHSSSPYHIANVENRKDVVALQNIVWEKARKEYEFLQYLKDIPKDFKNNKYLKRPLMKLIAVALKTKEYQTIWDQTADYAKYVEKQWKENIKKSHKIMANILRIDLDKKFTVFITHPGLKEGHYGGKNTIYWGGKQNKFPNYETVYLWHEILHSYLKRTGKSHAIIELATDNHLRAELNGGDYPPLVGHHDLNSVMKDLLDEWENYLEDQKQSIFNFEKSILENK